MNYFIHNLLRFLFFGLLFSTNNGSIVAQSTSDDPDIDYNVSEIIDLHGESWYLEQPDLWHVNEDILTLTRPGEFLEAIRRPSAIALMVDHISGSFTYTSSVRCTNPIDNIGRDIIVVFGYQSPQHFYYAHLSNDNNAMAHNGIFIVDEADRRRIDEPGLADPPETRIHDQDWHEIKIIRDPKTGSIAVYVDDLETPLMVASDTTFVKGRVGFGSFDNTGEVRDVRLIQQEK